MMICTGARPAKAGIIQFVRDLCHCPIITQQREAQVTDGRAIYQVDSVIAPKTEAQFTLCGAIDCGVLARWVGSLSVALSISGLIACAGQAEEPS